MISKRGHVLRLLTGGYILALTAGSLLPGGADAPAGWDSRITPTLQNALHAPAYAGLVILCGLAWSRAHRLGARSMLVLAAACIAFGGLMESAQMAVPGRTCSLMDALLNAVGVGIGVPILLYAQRRLDGRCG